jgi:uncharacterized protein YehS (DUF1456 family)
MNNRKFDNKIRTHIKEEIEENHKETIEEAMEEEIAGIMKKLKTRKASDKAIKKITNITNAIIKQERLRFRLEPET